MGPGKPADAATETTDLTAELKRGLPTFVSENQAPVTHFDLHRPTRKTTAGSVHLLRRARFHFAQRAR